MQEIWNRILVGIDFSPNSELALTQAVRLAVALRTRLDLAHIHQLTVSAVPELLLAPVDEKAALAEAERQLRDLAARISDRVCTAVHLRTGEPVSGLLGLVDELAPDFVVVGSHGRSAIMGVLLGSVSAQLCRHSRVPVLVVPAKERGSGLR